jgi:hypothetical protein
MRVRYLVAVSLVLAAGAVRAQTPDSSNAESARALFLLRDTTEMVRGELNRFRRDLEFAGGATVLNRAVRLNEACARLRAAVAQERGVFRSARLPLASGRNATQGLLAEMQRLDAALRTNCLEGLAAQGPGERADSLKAWGPYHSSRLQGRLLAYDGAAAAFARSIGIRLSQEGPGIVP